MSRWPCWTMRTVPGGSCSTGQTSISAKLGEIHVGEALGRRRPLRLVERQLERRQPEHRALEPHRRQLDADLLEQLVLVEDGHLARLPALDELRQHRGRRLRDRAAAALEAHRLDRLSVRCELDRDADLVAAKRVLALRLRVRRLDDAAVPRILVVIQNDLAVHLLELVHAAKTFCTLSSDSCNRSISSGTV